MGRRRASWDNLTEKEAAFLRAFIDAGAVRSAATAIVLEVYNCKDKRSASVIASDLLKKDKIRDILAEETMATHAVGAVQGTNVLMDMLETGMFHGQPVKPGDAIKCAKELIERGVGPIARYVEHRITDDRADTKTLMTQLVQELATLPEEARGEIMEKIGLDKRELVVIDAVAEVVDEPTVVDPQAPHGRKTDERPKKKPGPKPKRRLPGPEAYRPDYEDKDALQRRIDRVKASKLRKLNEAAKAELEENSDDD